MRRLLLKQKRSMLTRLDVALNVTVGYLLLNE